MPHVLHTTALAKVTLNRTHTTGWAPAKFGISLISRKLSWDNSAANAKGGIFFGIFGFFSHTLKYHYLRSAEPVRAFFLLQSPPSRQAAIGTDHQTPASPKYQTAVCRSIVKKSKLPKLLQRAQDFQQSGTVPFWWNILPVTRLVA